MLPTVTLRPARDSDSALLDRLCRRCGYTETVRSTQFRAPGRGPS